MQELEVLFMFQNAANVSDELERFAADSFGHMWESGDKSPSAAHGAGVVRERARVAQQALTDFLIGVEVWGAPDHRELAVNIRKALDVAREARSATELAEREEQQA